MTKWQPTASFKQWLFVSCCWGAWPGLGVSADSGFDKEIILLRVQITSFSLVTDVSTVTPRGDAPGWKAAVKFVEMPRSLGETQLRSPGSCLLLPAVLSWHYLLASPLNASLSCFAPRWKSFPSGRLMVLWGGCPQRPCCHLSPLPLAWPRGTTTLGWLSWAPPGVMFSL